MKDTIQTVCYIIIASFTTIAAIGTWVRAWIEWKTYKTQWWKAHKDDPQLAQKLY